MIEILFGGILIRALGRVVAGLQFGLSVASGVFLPGYRVLFFRVDPTFRDAIGILPEISFIICIEEHSYMLSLL